MLESQAICICVLTIVSAVLGGGDGEEKLGPAKGLLVGEELVEELKNGEWVGDGEDPVE